MPNRVARAFRQVQQAEATYQADQRPASYTEDPEPEEAEPVYRA